MESSLRHIERLKQLLADEQRYEAECHDVELDPSRFAVTVAEPDCRYPVDVVQEADYNALGQLVMSVVYEVRPDDPDTEMEPGCAVEFF